MFTQLALVNHNESESDRQKGFDWVQEVVWWTMFSYIHQNHGWKQVTLRTALNKAALYFHVWKPECQDTVWIGWGQGTFVTGFLCVQLSSSPMTRGLLPWPLPRPSSWGPGSAVPNAIHWLRGTREARTRTPQALCQPQILCICCPHAACRRSFEILLTSVWRCWNSLLSIMLRMGKQLTSSAMTLRTE